MAHINKLIDFTVEVFIVYKNTVLLRKHDKYHIWLGVGGHIELNEDPNEAAVREVWEEVGLKVKIDDSLLPTRAKRKNYKLKSLKTSLYKELIPPYFLNRHNITDAHEHIALIYFAKSKSNKVVQSKDEFSDDCRWFTRQEIEKNTEIRKEVKMYALRALKALGKD